MQRSATIIILTIASLTYLTNGAITQVEFNTAAIKNGFKTPSKEVFQNFAESTKTYSREEQAMLLAQLLHESVGFQFTEELACLKGNNCADNYKDNVGLPGKSYHGRGYIQLTWGKNYKASSQALGMGDKLLQNPEIVANDKKIGMQVSIWFWEINVRPKLKGHENQFGVTTMAINSGECKYPKYQDRAKKRWKIYLNVADAMKIAKKAMENGCYN